MGDIEMMEFEDKKMLMWFLLYVFCLRHSFSIEVFLVSMKFLLVLHFVVLLQSIFSPSFWDGRMQGHGFGNEKNCQILGTGGMVVGRIFN